MGSYKWVISPLIWVITIVTLLITPNITTHEPPGRRHPKDPNPASGAAAPLKRADIQLALRPGKLRQLGFGSGVYGLDLKGPIYPLVSKGVQGLS